MRALCALVALGVMASPAAVAAAVPQWALPVIAGQVPMDGGGFVSQIAAADLNGDGVQDLIVTRSVYLGQQTFPVTVLLGDGHGRFVDASDSMFGGGVPRTQNARKLVLADFNGDGRSDVFVADHGDDQDPFPGFQDTLILSAAGGKLADATANLPQASDFTHSGAAGDVNGDGATDIYVGNIWGGNRVAPRILLNDGSGHFTVGDGLVPTAQTNLDLNQYTSSLLVDVNGDAKLDLVLGAENNTPSSVVLLNDGTGHFTLLAGALPPKPFGPDAVAEDIATTDVNGDGKPDLLIAFTKSNLFTGRWVQVLIGNGDGTFRDATATSLAQSDNDDPWPTFIEQRDLDRDGHSDLGVRVGGGGGGSPLLYLLDPGTGLFRPGPTLNVGNSLWTFIDAQGDGSNDIVAVNPSTGAVSLFRELRSSAPPPPSDTIAPVLSRLSIRPTTFRIASRRARLRVKGGTTISYNTSEPVTTIFTVDRARAGIQRGDRCVKPPKRRIRAVHCTRFVPVAGSFSDEDVAGGPRRLRFTGKLHGSPLRPGAYRLQVTAKDTAGNIGNTLHARFRVVHR